MRNIKLPQAYLLTFTNGDQIGVVTEHVAATVLRYRQNGHALVTSEPKAWGKV